ncbi:hypothetical protein PHYSODRAFT_492766, partial [Phytophthora sojae]
GGLLPNCDVGIYKSFKDIMSKLIEEWKRSGKVTYPKAGNPKDPDIILVTSWLSQAGKKPRSKSSSVQACSFNDDSSQWHISKHDVYDSKFGRRGSCKKALTLGRAQRAARS